MKIKMKRIYEKPSSDGYRVLVDRLWPRGMSKENAHINEWNKDLAPSDKLRKWFNHDPELWVSFSQKYITELQKSDSVKEFLERNRKHEVITLLYAAKDEKHCHAKILKEYLEKLKTENKM
ncbi:MULTISPECIES: DUF488 domain-containing protein [Chryseobacterium]|uniref:Uncharacterized conserved protein n=2 Tax=Chryseobacterium TaxID=59732 RepID=A0A381FHE0_9FLAO|nr:MULTISPECIES: DUF488 family protein [Chryseobacterium]SFZ93080.1 Uncharacterized conserved protein YeaO, DUF488 family [Chryseobacterium limigenitum]SUX45957.1 Uncharacterized conserved protein [Chryseobacterium indoltheticum]